MEKESKAVASGDLQPERGDGERRVFESRTPELCYKELAKCYAPFVSTNFTPPDSLETLYHRTRRLKQLFVGLNRSWVLGSGEMQKACAYYLANAELPKKNRTAFIKILGDVAHSVCCLAACGDIIDEMQQYYSHQERELRQLLDERKGTGQRREAGADGMDGGEVAEEPDEGR